MIYPNAFVLHRYAYSENSLLLKILAPESSLIPVMAKGVKGGGARSGKSKRGAVAGLCEPFSLLSLECIGSGEVKTLKNLDLINISQRLTGDILICGLYLNELLLNLLGPAPCSQVLFDIYKITLIKLSEGIIEPALRFFEKTLLEEIGHGPNFSCDYLGQEIIPESLYKISPGEEARKIEKIENNLGSNIFEGKVLLAIGQNNFENKAEAKQAKFLLRQWLDFYMHGKVLKTRTMMMDMAR